MKTKNYWMLGFVAAFLGCSKTEFSGKQSSKVVGAQEASDPSVQGDVGAVQETSDGLDMTGAPLQNIALGKQAYQSSTSWNAPASRAVDGNIDGNFWAGSVTHTDWQAEPYLEIDLGADMIVTKVTVFNRTDCCSERLDNYELSLRSAGQQLVHSERKRVVPRPSDNINFSNKVARYVRIQLKEQMNFLSLAEVQVWGYPSPKGKLIRAFNNLCLDIAGASQNDGAHLMQYSCHGGTNQRFTFLPIVQDNRFHIKADHSGKCLAVSSFSKGASVVQMPCGNPGTYFIISEKSGDRLKIKEFVSGHCLEVPNSSYSPTQALRIWNCNGNDDQRFRITD